MQTGAIILAAGGSLRLGRPKQLLLYNNQTLLTHTIKKALSVAPGKTVVVTGANHHLLMPHLQPHEVYISENTTWQTGMASSIKCGLQTLLREQPGISGVLVLLCDQPFVDEVLLQLLTETQKAGENKIIATGYNHTAGVPALFPVRFFDELLRLDGQQGARKVIAANLTETLVVNFEKAAIDIDTQNDYEALLSAQVKEID